MLLSLNYKQVSVTESHPNPGNCWWQSICSLALLLLRPRSWGCCPASCQPCHAKGEHGKQLGHRMPVDLLENTHTLDLFASKVFNNLVLPIYMFLASTCVTEINYWQRDRARAAWKHVLSAAVFTDTWQFPHCLLLFPRLVGTCFTLDCKLLWAKCVCIWPYLQNPGLGLNCFYYK